MNHKKNNHLTTAMVLAAGLGTRMRPLTNHTPKSLVKVGSKPLIDWVLDALTTAGIKTAYVNVHHLADRVRNHLVLRESPEIYISDESEQLLDSGGGVQKALELIDVDDVIVANGDSIWIDQSTSAIGYLMQYWNPETMDAALLLTPVETAVGFDGPGDFNMNADGYPIRRPANGTARFAYMGLQVLNRRLFQTCPEPPFSLNVLWDRAIEENRLGAVVYDGNWFHVGTLEAIVNAEAGLSQLGVLQTND